MSRYHRMNPDAPHPFEHQLRYYETNDCPDDGVWLELLAERRKARHICPECRCTGYHAQGCPAAEDEENES